MSHNSFAWVHDVNNGRILSPVIIAQSQLPDPTSFVMGAWNMAWPQMLVWCSAVGGILLTSLLIKSFLGRN
jgi:hypothetical protein